jgi:hypothetical protein
MQVCEMDTECELEQSFALAGIPEVAEFLTQLGTSVATESISAVYAQKEWQADLAFQSRN